MRNLLRGVPLRWRHRLLTALVLWLSATVVLAVLGNDPRPGLLAGLVAVATGLWGLFLDATATAQPVRWQLEADEPVRARESDARLDLLERVVAAHLDARDTTDQLQRCLAALADERLVARHGVSRRADPDRAAQLLGRPLTDFLAQPHPRRLSLAQIDLLLTRIEAL
jgi:hypothetical protein